MMESLFEPGSRGAASMTVGVHDTAAALGSGDVEVLGTPRLVALAEEAACAAIAPRVAAPETTVGVRVELDHTKPTLVGDRVTADALLTNVEGRRLDFDVVVSDSRGRVASGKVVRMLVDRRRFLEESRGAG
jgi:predicted thioesterase